MPFCRSKCRYCAFYSVTRREQESRWLAGLAREAALYAAEWPAFDSGYVGGGSPSVVSDAGIEALVETLRTAFSFRPDTEWTIELNPADVSVERARRWRALGFNRASLGVQSFRDCELKWLGRRHDAAQASEAIGALRQAGFESISLDIIQGLPGQTLEQRLESARRAIECEPEHLSCYELSVEAGTPLAAQLAAELVSEHLAVESFSALSEVLSAAGYLHYEVSSFARGEGYRSRHNSKYWSGAPYLGLGPAAHSFRSPVRWANHRSLTRYLEALESGARAVAERELLTDEQLRWERVSLGLRTDRGVALCDLEAGPSPEPGGVGVLAWGHLEQQGLLRRHGDRVVATRQGLLVADGLARQLLFGR